MPIYFRIAHIFVTKPRRAALRFAAHNAPQQTELNLSTNSENRAFLYASNVPVP